MFEEKLNKMIKKTGMKARPVSPPPGKTWGVDNKAHRSSVHGRSHSPSLPEKQDGESQFDLVEGLEGDIKTFEASETRMSEIKLTKSGKMQFDAIDKVSELAKIGGGPDGSNISNSKARSRMDSKDSVERSWRSYYIRLC